MQVGDVGSDVNPNEFATVEELSDSPNEALDSVVAEGDELGGPEQETVQEEAEESVEAEASSEEEVEVEAEAEEVEAEEEKPTLGKGAQKRIKQLIEERDSVRAEVEAIRAESSRQLAAMQANYQRMVEQQRQEAMEIRRHNEARLAMERERAEREEYDKLPLSERIKWDATKKSRSEFEQLLAERDERYQQELNALRTEMQGKEQAEKRRARLAELSNDVDTSVAQVLLNSVDTSEFNDEDKAVFGEMFMGYAGGKGQYPKEAAPQFRKVMEKFARGYFKAKGEANKQRVQAGKKVPPVTPARGAKSSAGAGAVSQATGRPNNNARFRDPDSLFEHFANQAMKRP